MRLAGIITPLALMACEAPAPTAESLIPDYRGTQAVALAPDIVQIEAEMTNAITAEDVKDYTDCAVAEYAVANGFGFARHLRANVSAQGSVWTGKVAYLLSAATPEGLAVIDAAQTADGCRKRGIPLV